MKTPVPSTIPSKAIISALILTTCLWLGTGCQVHRNLRLEHAVGEAGVLRTVPSTKLALEVIDERPAGERDRVAQVAKVTYVVQGGLVSNLESALRAEFEKAGHQVVAAGTEGSSAVVRVVLQRFWAGYRETGGGTAIEKYAEINAEVRVGQVAFPVSVRQSRVYPLAAPGGMAEVVGPAYDEFIRNVTMDPQLMAALKNAK